jgi:hypothetical protein
MVLFGFDADRRPGLYMFPSRQNTNEPTRQIQFVVWMLERTIDLTGPGVECVIFVSVHFHSLQAQEYSSVH